MKPQYEKRYLHSVASAHVSRPAKTYRHDNPPPRIAGAVYAYTSYVHTDGHTDFTNNKASEKGGEQG